MHYHEKKVEFQHQFYMATAMMTCCESEINTRNLIVRTTAKAIDPILIISKATPPDDIVADNVVANADAVVVASVAAVAEATDAVVTAEFDAVLTADAIIVEIVATRE